LKRASADIEILSPSERLLILLGIDVAKIGTVEGLGNEVCHITDTVHYITHSDTRTLNSCTEVEPCKPSTCGRS
jgi:hypothetical protein